MAILTGPQILEEVRKGTIVIDPFDETRLNPNSYNLTLAKEMLVYDLFKPCVTAGLYYDEQAKRYMRVLDMKKDNPTKQIVIPEDGYILRPGCLYIASTQEYTETHEHAPMIEGRSSVGRLGMQCHVTAGFGDCNFCGTWTLELTVVHPLRIYAGVAVCQIVYAELAGARAPYSGKYQGQRGPRASSLWKDF